MGFNSIPAFTTSRGTNIYHVCKDRGPDDYGNPIWCPLVNIYSTSPHDWCEGGPNEFDIRSLAIALDLLPESERYGFCNLQPKEIVEKAQEAGLLPVREG